MSMVILLLLLSSVYIQKVYGAELDTITDRQFLTEGNTLVSPAKIFEMGFFSPGDSQRRYLGIWYKKISVKTVAWVANREHPLIKPSSGVLKIVPPGILILVNGTNDTVWSTNTTTTSSNAIAQLTDMGNLVVADKNQDRGEFIWQSFDYPTDTLLPGMKYGRDLLTGKEWYLTSWKSDEDPAPGEFTWSVDSGNYPQNLLKQGTVVKIRGEWTGVLSPYNAGFGPNLFTYNFVMNDKELVYTYYPKNNSTVTRFIMNSTGEAQRLVWVEDSKKWQLIFNIPKDVCDRYAICGAYSSCNIDNSQECVCLDNTRFVPKNREGWEAGDWSSGCVRRVPLECKSGSYGFLKYSNVRWPDTKNSWFNRSMSLKECEAKCSENCSCMAYANTDVRGEGSGCLLWFNDLIDIRVYLESNNSQPIFIFVRMASSELVAHTVSKKKGGASTKIILLAIFLGILLMGLSSTLFWYAQRKKKNAQHMGEVQSSHISQNQKGILELLLFDFSTIDKSTASFSLDNKLGEGGFGPVYKGVLEDGKEIAVKRLSKTSNQGLDEFKNEVIFISKLQHRNLVKLLGYCIEGDETMLIYEYMPNGSLDSFIFDIKRSMFLDWTKRFSIIKGIARGLLYLHQDSRLRIIHRDLKASNILLDLDMNPKISDFGLARSFGENETQANTQRVVGTYGYMSPEYVQDGVFSIKSDVFSFGVLVLEIVSGKRNRGFSHPEHSHNLIGHAWRLHKEGRVMEFIDATLAESCHPSEVLRSIEVGLLSVQQNPIDRPNMSSVLFMLRSEGALPQPKEPAFFTGWKLVQVDCASSHPTSSANYFTITELDAR